MSTEDPSLVIFRNDHRLGLASKAVKNGGTLGLIWVNGQAPTLIWKDGDSPLGVPVDKPEVTFYPVIKDGRFWFTVGDVTNPPEGYPFIFDVTSDGLEYVYFSAARVGDEPKVYTRLFRDSMHDSLNFYKENVDGTPFSDDVEVIVNDNPVILSGSSGSLSLPVTTSVRIVLEADGTDGLSGIDRTIVQVGGGQEADVELGPPPKP